MELQFIVDRLEAIDQKFDEKLDKILVQTTKTNGRVASLEKWRALVAKIIWWVLGVIAAVAIMLLDKYLS